LKNKPVTTVGVIDTAAIKATTVDIPSFGYWLPTLAAVDLLMALWHAINCRIRGISQFGNALNQPSAFTRTVLDHQMLLSI
jgi:hypothetical protein